MKTFDLKSMPRNLYVMRHPNSQENSMTSEYGDIKLKINVPFEATLSSVGVHQAEHASRAFFLHLAAERIRRIASYTSPFGRAKDGIEIMKAIGAAKSAAGEWTVPEIKEMNVIDGLREIHMGIFKRERLTEDGKPFPDWSKRPVEKPSTEEIQQYMIYYPYLAPSNVLEVNQDEMIKLSRNLYFLHNGESMADLRQRLANIESALKKGRTKNALIVSHGTTISLIDQWLCGKPIEQFQTKGYRIKNAEIIRYKLLPSGFYERYNAPIFAGYTKKDVLEEVSRLAKFMEPRIDRTHKEVRDQIAAVVPSNKTAPKKVPRFRIALAPDSLETIIHRSTADKKSVERIAGIFNKSHERAS